MRAVLYFLFILFLEVICGVILALLYWLLSSLLFDKEGFGRSRINEAIYYIVILSPPFIYCWMEHSKFKREGFKTNSVIYLSAGIAYLVGGIIYMLFLTGFYLVGN